MEHHTQICFVSNRQQTHAQGCYAALSRWELNPRPIDRKFNAYAVTLPAVDYSVAARYLLGDRGTYV